MISRRQFKLLSLALVVAAVCLLALACGGSKAQSNTKQGEAAPGTQAQPQPVDVTTAPAILRQLPRFLEVTGSLIADEQTDVAPALAGKVIAIGVDWDVGRARREARASGRPRRAHQPGAGAAQVERSAGQRRQSEARIGLRPGQSFDATRVAEVGRRASRLSWARSSCSASRA